MKNAGVELITWSNSYSCGIKLIDDQHKILINMINDMFIHVTGSEKEEKDYLFEIVHNITEYIQLHCKTEEKIMVASKYDGYSKHKKEHESIILNFIEKANECLLGNKLTLYLLAKYLKEWIFTHISVMDKNYFKYYREIAGKTELPAVVNF